jgi:hypothetical protein
MISSFTVLRDILTLGEDPGVSEYLSAYILFRSGRSIDATSMLPCKLEAPPVWRCGIAQLPVWE